MLPTTAALYCAGGRHVSDCHAFIFDLDGTLVDSLQDITNALNAALTGIHRAPAEASKVRSWIGSGLLTLCRRAVNEDDPTTIAKLVQLTAESYAAHSTDHTRLYPKLLKILDLLHDRRTPMALLSNKPHALTVQLVKGLAIDRYFAEVRGCTEEQDKKPSPKNALAIAELLGVEPRRVFFIGDSPLDVETARNAGMIAVAVTWGFNDRPELEAAHPDFFVDDPDLIPDLPKRASKLF